MTLIKILNQANPIHKLLKILLNSANFRTNYRTFYNTEKKEDDTISTKKKGQKKT